MVDVVSAGEVGACILAGTEAGTGERMGEEFWSRRT